MKDSIFLSTPVTNTIQSTPSFVNPEQVLPLLQI